MEFLQTIDPNTLTLILVGLAVMCVGGIVLFFLSQVFGILGGIISAITGVVGGVTGNPIACCGCLVLGAILVVCGGLFLLISNALAACGTPAATNLCTLLGR